MIFIIMILASLLAAFLGSLVGLGGGMILVPILIFLHHNVTGFEWATTQSIVAITLVAMIFTALSSLRAYLKIKTVDIKTGIILLTGTIPGSILGTWLNGVLDTSKFSLYFGIFLVLMFLLLLIDREKLGQIRKPKKTDRIREFEVKGETYTYHVSILVGFFVSFTIGTLSALFGIGGGIIAVPAMIILFGMPVHIAIATSMFMIFFASLFSATTHAISGNVVWGYALFFIIGAILGGTLGARVNQLLKGKALEWILRILILVMAAQLIFGN
ncbi:MAG TPA: sulfite exporter TauE/SafE family protein [Pseudogracilibacillus sp.]|nr:sulfite exporter TauE/SafE family protein [Pseudogracilibacillus sp.]